MRNFSKLTGSIVTLIALSACGNLSKNSSSTSTSSGSNSATSTSAGSAVALNSFSPATGVYNAIPTTVTLSFSSSVLDPSTASAASSYSIICGGNATAASSVAFVSGLSTVTVTLPPIIGLTEGTVCTFTVSSSLLDGYGNYVTGTHSVNYQYSSSGSTVGSSSSWVESSTVSYTSTIGNPVANYFQGVGASGVAMSGINVNGSTYVDGISGLWSNGFTSTTNTAGPIQGNSTESFTALSCPSGYRMTGITGRSGAYIDSIAIICKTQDQSQTWTSSTFGGAGGTSYTLSCPSGKFVTDLDGTSGAYLDALYLGCR